VAAHLAGRFVCAVQRNADAALFWRRPRASREDYAAASARFPATHDLSRGVCAPAPSGDPFKLCGNAGP
jgi:hypothetical protein